MLISSLRLAPEHTSYNAGGLRKADLDLNPDSDTCYNAGGWSKTGSDLTPNTRYNGLVVPVNDEQQDWGLEIGLLRRQPSSFL